MQSELRAIEKEFEALAERLAALMNDYAEDPRPAHAPERLRRAFERATELRRAFEKATEVVTVLRMYRTSRS